MQDSQRIGTQGTRPDRFCEYINFRFKCLNLGREMILNPIYREIDLFPDIQIGDEFFRDREINFDRINLLKRRDHGRIRDK